MTLSNQTENKTVNSIANYLNKIIEEKYKKLNSESKELLENTNIDTNSNVQLKLELVNAGLNNLSFVYTKEGKLNGKNVYDSKGSTFYYNGEIKNYDAEGFKESIKLKAINEFRKSELYAKYKNQLDKNYEKVIYDNMFLTGNWYLVDNKMIFLIPANLLGLNSEIASIVKIEIELEEDI